MSFRLLKILTEIQENVQGSGNNLATSNQSQQILAGLNTIESLISNLPVVNYSTELATLLTVLNALTSSVSSLPTQTYTTQLNGLQTAVDTIPVIDYNNRFNSVDNAIQAIRNNQQNQGTTGGNVPDYSNQLNSIQARVNLLPSYSSQNDTANISTKVDDLAVLVDGRASNSQANQLINDVANLSSSISGLPRDNQTPLLQSIQGNIQAIPKATYNDSFNQQTTLIGGVSTQVSNIYSDTQAIKNTELPKLATGNQANNIQSSINSLNSSIANIPRNNYQAQLDRVEATGNSARTESQNIPRATYNGQLTTIQTGVNNIPVNTYNVALGNIQNSFNTIPSNTYNAQLSTIQSSINAIPNYTTSIANASSQGAGANASVQTLSSSQSSRFNGVDSSLSGISTQISSLTGSNGGASSVVSLNASALICPYVANNPERDLMYLLGATATGYTAIGGVTVGVTANSTETGDPLTIFGKVSGSGFYTTNASGRILTLDLGLNKTTRNLVLTGLGIQSYAYGGAGYPVNLVISGSNNNSTYTTINTWSAIGFDSDAQWKYTTFTNSTAYRYIRIALSGLTTTGTNYLGLRELRLYGTINNP